MLTFEKVLDVFQSFLAEGVYEIVSTSHGYTILEWDSYCQEWISVKLCATPDDMAETLLEHLTNYLEYKAGNYRTAGITGVAGVIAPHHGNLHDAGGLLTWPPLLLTSLYPLPLFP